MNELIAMAAMTILAVISPGPDFAMVTRSSYAYGTKIGLLAALGIAFGVQVHVFYTVFGVTLLIMSSPTLFTIVKLFGVGYLIYIGFSSFTNKQKINTETGETPKPTRFSAFKMGFLTNALNPKTMLFVVSVYTQVLQNSHSLMLNLSYGFFISFVHWLWFSLIALFFAAPVIRNQVLNYQFVVDKIIGLLLMALGVSLLFLNIK